MYVLLVVLCSCVNLSLSADAAADAREPDAVVRGAGGKAFAVPLRKVASVSVDEGAVLGGACSSQA